MAEKAAEKAVVSFLLVARSAARLPVLVVLRVLVVLVMSLPAWNRRAVPVALPVVAPIARSKAQGPA